MVDDPAEDKIGSKVIQVFQSRQYRASYINTWRMGLRREEAFVTFGLEQMGPNFVTYSQDEFTAILNPRGLKTLANIFARLVERYEATYGEVELPQGTSERIEAGIKELDKEKDEAAN
jgi:hypothetical protein